METTKKIIVIDGPRGVGKDTVIRVLLERHDEHFAKMLTTTTRAPRHGEKVGWDYHFTDEKTFLKKLKAGDIFEYTTYNNNYYGMSRHDVEALLKTDKTLLFNVDVVGYRALKKEFPNMVAGIYLTVDRALLENRLHSLGEQNIAERLAYFDKKEAVKPEYDFVITNNNSIDECVDKILNLIHDRNKR